MASVGTGLLGRWKHPTAAFSQSERWNSLDTDAAGGCIRDVAHAYSSDGGLAVLKGNLAADGCVVKTAGVDESSWTFEGPAVVCESQEEAVDKILRKDVGPGDVVVIRYEGPKGGPQEGSGRRLRPQRPRPNSLRGAARVRGDDDQRHHRRRS